MVGQQSAQAIQGMIQNASSQPKTGVLSAVMGVVALILDAGGVVGQLQTSLNTIWGVDPKSGKGCGGSFANGSSRLQWYCLSAFCF